MIIEGARIRWAAINRISDQRAVRILRLIIMWVLCSCVVLPGTVFAQTDAQRADQLFKEGRALFDKRNFEEACAKLAESDQLNPTINAIGLLAACHEEQGLIASAW